MRSCFPRRLQWGYESNQSGSAEWAAQTVSCWAEAVDVGGAPTVGEQEALPWLGVQNLSSSNCNRQQAFLQKLAEAHKGCGPHLVCHFCSFVSKRCQIRNGCVTDHDMGTVLLHVGSGEISFPFKHCCLLRNLCLHTEGSDAEQPWIPRAVHSSQQGFRQQYPSRLAGFAWRSKNSCTCKPLQIKPLLKCNDANLLHKSSPSSANAENGFFFL